MIGLTKRQSQLLDFLKEATACDGVAPTYDEMAAAMGVKSKSNIHYMLSAIAERGFIRHIPNRARAIEIIEHPTLGKPIELSLVALAQEAKKRGMVIGKFEGSTFYEVRA